MSATAVELDVVAAATRWRSLDGFRGLAVLLMIVDHVCVLAGGQVEVRYTLGRLAMPMFFLLAGYLATRPRWRHLGVASVGVALPLVVPWIDSPNVLVLWAVGVVVLWAWRAVGLPAWLMVAAGVTVLANGWGGMEHGYPPAGLWALMGLGSMLSAGAFAWADRAPGWVVGIGRHPILWYVGHLCGLQTVFLLLGVV